MAKLTRVQEGDANGLQVVFVHGLNLKGSKLHHRATWMHNGADDATLWPCWLGQDSGCGCWLAQYDADAFTLTGDAMDLTDQGTALLNALAAVAALKGRPLVLVGHSLGGLVIKQALVHAGATSQDARLMAVLPQVKAVVFVASPHQGSQLASLARAMRWLVGINPQLGSMGSNDVHLKTLNSQFKKLRATHNWAMRVFAETHPLRKRLPLLGWPVPWLKVLVVNSNSSDPACEGCEPIPVPADHVQIACPATRQDEPYPTVLGLVHSLQPAPAGLASVAAPWPELPPLGQLLSAAQVETLRQWAAQPATDIQRWALHRYATLRLGRLGGEESAGHESFVNLHLQPVHAVAAMGAEATQPQVFDTVDALLTSEPNGRNLWLLKGAPGAGKSTLLRDLELRRLHTAIDHWRLHKPGLPELCMAVSLAQFDASAAGLQLQLHQALPARWAWQCVAGLPTGAEETAAPVTWQSLAQVARLRPLVDGLNEATFKQPGQQRSFTNALHEWATQQVAAGCCAPVFTVRQLNYMPFLNSADWAAVRLVDVQGWTLQQIEKYCDKRFPGQANPVWRAVQALPDTAPARQRSAMLELFANPFNLAAQCWLFAQTRGQARAGLAPNRGVLLGRMALLRLQDAATRRVPELLAEGLLDWSADESAIARQAAQTPPGVLHHLPLQGSLLRRLQALAHTLHQRSAGGWGRLMADDPLLACPQSVLPVLQAAQALKLAGQHANGDWQFDHQLWQEYLAACSLARVFAAATPPPAHWAQTMAAPALQAVPADAWELPSPEASPWDQAVQLAVQLANPAAAQALLQRLWVPAGPGGAAGAAAGEAVPEGCGNLAMAARAAAGRLQDLPAQLLAPLRQALLARSTSAACDLRLRIEAGLLLGHLGDDIRYVESPGTDGQTFRMPRPNLWIEVPAGTHTVGGLTDFRDSANTATANIAPGTQLAFAPVTQAEFACFVQAGGYGGEDDPHPPPWWQGTAAIDWWHGRTPSEGLSAAWMDMRQDWHDPKRGRDWVARVYLTNFQSAEIDTDIAPKMALPEAEFNAYVAQLAAPKKERRPAGWDSSRFNNPLQPVVGVSLWEAQAYCRWLSRQSGLAVRLPTEAEWEVAARGGGQRGVHWPGLGAEGPAATDANQLATRVRSTTPVAVFAGGTTPEGWVDLCGQVWEWTGSGWTPEGIDAKKVNSSRPLSDAAERAVRGGAWDNPGGDCRAAVRNSNRPSNRNDYLGFRLLVCPIQSPVP